MAAGRVGSSLGLGSWLGAGAPLTAYIVVGFVGWVLRIPRESQGATQITIAGVVLAAKTAFGDTEIHM